MQGVSFLPVLKNPAATVRQHAFSEHNWHDYEAHGRAVRSEGFLYISNHRPALAWQGPADSVRGASHQALRAARSAGPLTPGEQNLVKHQLQRQRPQSSKARLGGSGSSGGLAASASAGLLSLELSPPATMRA